MDSLLDFFPNEMVLYVYMFCPLIILGSLSHVACTLIIEVRQYGEPVCKFEFTMEYIVEIHSIPKRIGQSFVLCLAS